MFIYPDWLHLITIFDWGESWQGHTEGDIEQQHPQKAAWSPGFGRGVPITVGPGFVNVPDGDLPDILHPYTEAEL